MSIEKVRIDRWLWSVRIYKTRTLATDACKRNWVKINDSLAKPSKDLVAGDIVSCKCGKIQKKFRVLGVLDKRVSAKLVNNYLVEITPLEEIQKGKAKRNFLTPIVSGVKQSKGRPSKKKRRDLEEFFSQFK